MLIHTFENVVYVRSVVYLYIVCIHSNFGKAANNMEYLSFNPAFLRCAAQRRCQMTQA